VAGFLVAVFRPVENDGIVKVDTIIMSQAQFIASGLPEIHSIFRIRLGDGQTSAQSKAGMIIIPEIVENMNGRLHRGYTYSVKLPSPSTREDGGSDCQYTNQWKDNQNCKPGWQASPKRGDGGWDYHCSSCCTLAFKYEWKCFKHNTKRHGTT
jgi:hypothetical protein